MKVLEVKNLNKSFGKREILKDISFSVEEGEIFGFLGPNGAGKTTTIKILVGLITQDKGTVSVFGNDLHKNKEKALANVGAIVENPEPYGYLTGRENLNQFAKIRNVSKKEVEDIITLIGLEKRIDDKVKKYSLGMKQRLGVGIALLGSPKLLILDEPTNGLDPSGILDLREIIKKAAKENKMAVFVSSHILAEVEQLCDTVAFVNHGEVKAVEKVYSIGAGINTETYIVDCNPVVKAVDILEKLPSVDLINVDDTKITLSLKEGMKGSYIIAKLVSCGIEIDEAFKKYCGLEQRYIELVEGGTR